MDYTIKRGDTLLELARRFNTTVEKLAQDNHLASPELISEGALLRVADEPASAPEAPAAPPDSARVSKQAQGEIETYQAQDLSKVAYRAREASQAQPVARPERPPVEAGGGLARPGYVPMTQGETPADQPFSKGRYTPFGTDPVRAAEPTRLEPPAEPVKAEPEPESDKGWFDRLVEGGEDLVKDTVGQIPLIGGLFTAQAQVTGGALKAVGDMVGGVATAVAHPVNTLKGLWGLAAHLPFSPPNMLHVANQALHGKGLSEILQEEGDYAKGLWNGLTSGYQQSIKDGRWGEVPGRLIVDVGSLLIGAGEATGAAKGAAVAGKAAETTNAVAKTAKVAEVAADAGKAARSIEVAGTASKASKVAETASTLSKATKAVEAFKASTLGKAVLDVTAGMQLMGDAVGDFAKAMVKGIRESAGKVPAADLAKAELLSEQSAMLAREFASAQKLEGAAAAERMSELAKHAAKLARDSEQLAGTSKGLKGMAQALKTRADVAAEAFSKAGGASAVLDLGKASLEAARSLGEVGLEAGKLAVGGAAKLGKATAQRLSLLGDNVGVLASKVKAAGALRGEAALKALGDAASKAKSLAAEARALAAKTGDVKIGELAERLAAQEANLRKAAAVASIGIPLNAAEAARLAVE